MRARYAALVLAGRRSAEDPLARAAGAPHRALLDVGGEPMLERVLRALDAAASVDGVEVSIDDPDALRSFSQLAAREAAGALRLSASAASPSRSVLAGLERAGTQPLLVTTADHALLQADWVEAFLREADRDADVDVAVALVAASRIRAAFPDARRTYLPFRGERYSGANLFAFRTPRARAAAEFWSRAEHQRKRPWRLVATFGFSTLLLFLLRRLDLAAAFERASSIVGVRIAPIVLPFAEAAIDVDKLADWELVKQLVAREGSA
ncbi:MAG: nucleotidyltransferase family protein [Proteobacteria bacterium]|nr:nucleotidyltransferase family protein [Pseudomonadota bacterium]